MSNTELIRTRSTLHDQMGLIAAEIDTLFDAVLVVPPDTSGRLIEAVRYASIGAGKRLRPLLVCAAGDLFDVPRQWSIRAGLAVECVHAHSLIHDDLPCMDDDDLRRGKPTVHVAFGEATAVLAGDALLAMAFDVLCDPEMPPSPKVWCELASDLARAAGAYGMAGGQMMDLLPSDEPLDMDAVARLQRLKTGALIGWSVDAGAMLGAASPEMRTSLRGYAQKLGLAFQIADDLLDVSGDESQVGKRLRKDREQGKQTFVTLLGAERAQRQATLLVEQAIEHLYCFEGRAQLLAEIAAFAVNRDR